MGRVASRALAVGSGILALIASLTYTLAVTRRLPQDGLAVLTVFNAGLAVAQAFLGYLTTWYVRILAKEPQRFGELLAAGLLALIPAWLILTAYLILYGRADPLILALGAAVLFAYVSPAGAYLSVFRQTLLSALGYVSQAVKIAGAFLVRTLPNVYTALAISAAMLLPAAASKLGKPDFKAVGRVFREVSVGAPYQTLSLIGAVIGSAITYAIFLAGGSVLLAYNYLLFQIGKSVYPALTLVPLIYGSMLAGGDRLRRALLDGAAALYIYLLASAVMAKAPEWYIAVLRPSELGNNELIEAVRLNAIATLISGMLLHLNTTIQGLEEVAIFTLRDRPAKALLWDIATAPIAVGATFLFASWWGPIGMVTAFILSGALEFGYRLRLAGPHWRPLFFKLYAPLIVALGVIYIAPLPKVPYAFSDAVSTIVTFIPNALLLAAAALALQTALSPPTREALRIAFIQITRQR